MMNPIHFLSTVAIAGGTAMAPVAIDEALAHAFNRPAASGYDVVAYQVDETAARGSGHHVSVHEGVTYLFANEANRETFEADPERFVPAYGGYCAYGVAVGKKFAADPEVWAVVDGRLYLNLDAEIQGLWSKDVPGHIAKADRNWTTIRDRDPDSL